MFTNDERRQAEQLFKDVMNGEVKFISIYTRRDKVSEAVVNAVDCEFGLRAIEDQAEAEGRERTEGELERMEELDLRKLMHLRGQFADNEKRFLVVQVVKHLSGEEEVPVALVATEFEAADLAQAQKHGRYYTIDHIGDCLANLAMEGEFENGRNLTGRVA